MARRSFIRKRKKEILLVIALIATVAIVFFLTRQQTQIIHEEVYISKTKSESYVFKEEEYVTLDDQDKIKFSIKEGTKVGANTLLSKTSKLNTNKYIKDAIKVINWKLKNKTYNKRDVFITDLREVDNKIEELQEAYDSVKDGEDAAKISKAEKELTKAKEKREMMQKSLKYIFADESTLKKIKSELNAKLNNFNNNLTISNINFSFTGYIYFSTAGYENVLDANVLPAINKEYLDYIREYMPDKENIKKDNVIKIVNNEAAYVCSFVDTEQFVSAEASAINRKQELAKDVDFDKAGGYYDYLERRVDILKSFPTIRFEDEKGNVTTGYLLDVHKTDTKKALIICVKDGINNIMTLSKTNLTLYTEEVAAFILPKRAILEIDGKTYISVITTGKFKELVPVEIFKYESGEAFLKPGDNEEVTENMEVILNPN